MTVSQPANRERIAHVQNGWVVLALLPVALVAVIAMVATFGEDGAPVTVPIAIVTILLIVITLFGFFTLQPNEARVLVLFGKYMGTVRESGFHWGNPFYTNGSRQQRK